MDTETGAETANGTRMQYKVWNIPFFKDLWVCCMPLYQYVRASDGSLNPGRDWMTRRRQLREFRTRCPENVSGSIEAIQLMFQETPRFRSWRQQRVIRCQLQAPPQWVGKLDWSLPGSSSCACALGLEEGLSGLQETRNKN